MPLTSKGKKILKAMELTYGGKKKAEEVFYSMIQKRRLSGVEEINDKYGTWRPDSQKRDGKRNKKEK